MKNHVSVENDGNGFPTIVNDYGYTSNKDYIVFKYKLSDTDDIDNSVLFSSNKEDVKLNVSCIYSKCKVDISGGGNDNYYLTSIRDGNSKPVGGVAAKSVNYNYPLGNDTYDDDTISLHASDGSIVKSNPISIHRPKLPQDVVGDSNISTNFGGRTQLSIKYNRYDNDKDYAMSFEESYGIFDGVNKCSDGVHNKYKFEINGSHFKENDIYIFQKFFV